MSVIIVKCKAIINVMLTELHWKTMIFFFVNASEWRAIVETLLVYLSYSVPAENQGCRREAQRVCRRHTAYRLRKSLG